MQRVIYSVLFITTYNNIYSQSKDLLCGKINSNIITGKIVGGYDVGYYKYSWFAVLILNDEIICGATLISSKTILTAAHCFKPYFKNIINGNVKIEDIYTIKLGLYNNCKKEITQKLFHCTKIYLHENYFEEMPYFDIALITLKEDAKDFMPICLPDKVIRNNEGIVQGFGKLHANNETVPCTLQEAHLLVYSESKCKNMLEYHGQNSSELQHAFCAGYLNGKVDTCMGDSGGPFVVVDKTGRYIQQGITSFGFGCAKRNALGIYTDVSHFVDWIYDKIDTEEQNIFIPSNNATLITPVNSAHQLHFETEHKISINTNSQKFFWPFRFRRPKKKYGLHLKQTVNPIFQSIQKQNKHYLVPCLILSGK